jgi:C-terminal processing protease CtpA/Prc
LTTNFYKADTNFDHVFDDKDGLSGKKLFCLSSPCSFRCGNLLPAMLKESGAVTMLGQTSGGGACSTYPITLADGTFYQVSGYRMLSTCKNGIFYDIDRGVEPDYRLSDFSEFYSRDSLTTYIDSLH